MPIMTPRLGLFVLATLCLLINSQLGRPIWLDEAMELALGAFETTAEAWAAFLRTAGGLNHGQTGAYYMIGHWVGRVFGANVFALRMPSMLFAAFFLYSVHYFLSQLKVRPRWHAWAFLAIVSHRWLSDYFAEARPYMALTACTMGMFAYYVTPLAERKKWQARVIVWVSAVLGCLFHPFFSVYWLLASAFGYLHLRAQKKPAPLFSHLNLAACAVGTVLYFALGSQTWLAHKVAFFAGFDPFYWLPKQWSPERYGYATHFLYLRMFKIPMTALFAAAAVGMFFVPRLKPFRGELVRIFSIIVVALAVSVFLSYLSYRVNYWILERQWIASIALIVVATTWFVSVIERALPAPWSKVWAGLALGLMTLNAGVSAYDRVQKMVEWHQLPDQIAGVNEHSTIEEVKDWETLARANCAKGGPVWPEFKKLFR